MAVQGGGRRRYLVRRGVRVYQAPSRGGIRHLQLYTPPGRPAISLEPLSCPPNAINLWSKGCEGIDLCELEPGEDATFRISVFVDASQVG